MITASVHSHYFYWTGKNPNWEHYNYICYYSAQTFVEDVWRYWIGTEEIYEMLNVQNSIRASI